MEGTSGAADLVPLRGGPGEAALGPRCMHPAKAGARRGHVSLRSLVHTSEQGSRGGIVGGVPLQLVWGGGRTASGSPPGARRSRDMRCPSGSGWGEALVVDPASRKSAASRHLVRLRTRGLQDERRRAAKAGRPLTRETSAGGARRVGWSLIEASSRRPSRAARLGDKRRATPPGSGGRHGGWLQPHPEVSSQPSASWARRVGELGAGIGRSSGCARGLNWLQKSTRGTWSSQPT